MSKIAASATGLLLLAALTGGCVVDATLLADVPTTTTVRTGGSVNVSHRDRDYEEPVVMVPSRRAPIVVAAPVRDTTPTAVSSDARNPVIQAFTANPTNIVEAGQPITFQVVAHDPGNQPLQYNWAATGGTLSTTTGQLVIWNPPAKAGTYTVQTMISNARGGATSGSQNLIVKADGSVNVPGNPAPAPAPAQVAENCDCDDEAPVTNPAGELEALR